MTFITLFIIIIIVILLIIILLLSILFSKYDFFKKNYVKEFSNFKKDFHEFKIKFDSNEIKNIIEQNKEFKNNIKDINNIITNNIIEESQLKQKIDKINFDFYKSQIEGNKFSIDDLKLLIKDVKQEQNLYIKKIDSSISSIEKRLTNLEPKIK